MCEVVNEVKNGYLNAKKMEELVHYGRKKL